ncbi:hypothetical protein PSJE_03255 [Pseudomonas jessenii]|nr:hypothetical protein PSJE_03255 [Pseudomonas jessenii]
MGLVGLVTAQQINMQTVVAQSPSKSANHVRTVDFQAGLAQAHLNQDVPTLGQLHRIAQIVEQRRR